MPATQGVRRIVSLWSAQPSGRRFGLAAAVLFVYVVADNIGASIIATGAGFRGAIAQVFALSMTPAYSPAQAQAMLTRLGAAGRTADRLTLIAFDVLFPIVYTTALSFGLRWAARRAGLGRRPITILGLYPAMGGLANWLADLAIIEIISIYPRSSPSIALAASALTTVKLAVIGSSAIAIVVLGIISALRYVFRARPTMATGD